MLLARKSSCYHNHRSRQHSFGPARRAPPPVRAQTGTSTPGAQEELTSTNAVCKRLDEILSHALEQRDAEDKAIAVVTSARDTGLLVGFGRGLQVPKAIYSIQELRLNKVEPEKLLSPEDKSLNAVRNVTQGAALAGFAAFAYANHFDMGRLLTLVASGLFVLTADQVANGGGGEGLVLDTMGRLLRPSYGRRVALHESGHFLVAYLLGVLPKVYTLSSLDAFLRYRALNIQAGCQFCDRGFEAEVASGRLSSRTLDSYTCVALAGVVTEYLRFGQAEGGVGDVAQLDRLLRALQFTQKKADAQIRWAVLNVAALLRRHAALQDKLAAAMDSGASVGSCIELLERELATDLDALAPSSAA